MTDKSPEEIKADRAEAAARRICLNLGCDPDLKGTLMVPQIIRTPRGDFSCAPSDNWMSPLWVTYLECAHVMIEMTNEQESHS